jgi:general secretion pathway protein A
MYLAHYGLRKKPFDISPDPDFLWLGEKHTEGLAILKYGILENKGFLLITGDVGTGKTALIRAIEKEVEGRAVVVTIPDPSLSLMDFYNFMASELGMEHSFANKGEFLIAFKKLIIGAFSSYRRVLLIIDESQRLNSALLEEIRLLSNIDLAGKVLINIFFVGQTEFREMLAREENRAVRQRISVSYHIQPLTLEEVRQYVTHRLKVGGTAGEVFTPAAVEAVHAGSRGYPRLINIICDHALMSGYSRGVNRIDADIVRECEDELRITIGAVARPVAAPEPPPRAAATEVAGPVPEPQQSHPGRSTLVLAGVAALLTAVWFFWGERISDELARLGQRPEARATAPPAPGGAAPPLAVESGPRAPHSAEPAAAPPPPAAPAVSPQPPPAIDPAPAAKESAIATTAAGPPTPPAPQAVSPPPPPAAPAPQVTTGPAPGPAALPSPPAAFPLKDFLVFFTQNSTEIPVYANDMLLTAAALMKSRPNVAAVIEGHTDSVGDPAYNRIVAENRAAAVRSFLLAQGVAPTRLTLMAFGSDKPIDTNGTVEGRSKNRRVVIRLVPEKAGG